MSPQDIDSLRVRLTERHWSGMLALLERWVEMERLGHVPTTIVGILPNLSEFNFGNVPEEFAKYVDKFQKLDQQVLADFNARCQALADSIGRVVLPFISGGADEDLVEVYQIEAARAREQGKLN